MAGEEEDENKRGTGERGRDSKKSRQRVSAWNGESKKKPASVREKGY